MANEWTNVTVTKGAFVIPIEVTKDEEVLNKILFKITPATTKQNYSSGKKDTLMIDLLRIEERINIDGLLTSSGTATQLTLNASAKKSDLKSAFKAGGVMNLSYEGSTTCTGNMDKLSIDKVHKDGNDPELDEVGYKVKFTFIKGIDM